MGNTDNNSITPESVLASVKEMFAEASERLDRELQKTREEFKQRNAEASERLDRELQKSREEFKQRNAESSERLDRELQKSREEFEKRNAESSERSDREWQKLREEREKADKAWEKKLAPIKEMIGGMANSDGDYAEDFFYNALYHGQRKMFGEVFDEVVRRNKVTINKGYEDEYDILLVNGRALCIVEVKYKADSSDLPHKVLRKAETFRVNFPQHKDKKVYLAIAGMSFHPLTEKACSDNGLAIMKQVGDVMVVTEENLKTF